MEIIAAKSKGIFFLYFFLLLIGIGLHYLASLTPSDDIFDNYIGIAIAVISLIFLIHYFTFPSVAVVLDKNGNFRLHKHIVLKPEQISFARYKRHSRNIFMRSGKLILETDIGNFSYSYISDVEEVCRIILEKTIKSPTNKN